MEGEEDKGSVCVTGGTGYVASWLIMRLLQHGYSVHTTIRSNPGCKRDISYLTNLPGASEKLKIFNADLDKPNSFDAAIEGCIGVFHVAHIIDFENKESEEIQTKKTVGGTLGLLQACVNSNTVKRVVYTSSVSAVGLNGKDLGVVVDESSWSDVDFVRAFKPFETSYVVSKILTERAALEFAEKHGLDVVTINPSFINGPFICPRCPSSVRISLAMIFGNEDQYKYLLNIPYVHIEDVATAHIFLLEYPNAKGRYICSAVQITIDDMAQFLSTRYPEYPVPKPNCLKDVKGIKFPRSSSKKLSDTGFKYKYGLEEMFDGAIQCCKQMGFL